MRYLLLVACALASPSFALPTDSLELAHVKADLVDIDPETTTGHYAGHVKFRQGSTHFTADNVTTQFNEQHHLIYAIAKTVASNRTHFWVIPQLNAQTFHAYAKTIEYFPDKHLVVLTGNASISQGDNKLSAPRIQYQLDSKQLKTTKSGNEKTHISLNQNKDKHGSLRSPSSQKIF